MITILICDKETKEILHEYNENGLFELSNEEITKIAKKQTLYIHKKKGIAINKLECVKYQENGKSNQD